MAKKFEAKLGLDTKEFDDKLDKTQGKWGKWGGVIKSITGVLAVVSAAFAAIVTVMKGTEGGMDKLTLAVQTAKGAYHGLIETFHSGDWLSLIDNINKTAKAYRDMAAAQDMIEDISASNEVQKAYMERMLQSARVAAAGATDPQTMKQFLTEAIDWQKQITSLETSELNQRIKIYEDYFRTKLGMDDEATEKVIDNFRKLTGQENQLWGEMGRLQNYYYQRDALLSKQKMIGLTEVEKQTLHNINAQIAYIEIYKEMRDAMKPGEFNEYVKLVGQLDTAYASGEQSLVRLTSALRAANAEIKDFTRMAPDMSQEMRKITLEDFLPVGEMPEIDIPEIKPIRTLFDNFDQVEQWYSIWESAILNVTDLMIESFSKAFQAIGSGEWSGVGKEILGSFGAFISNLGKMLVAYGVMQSAFMKSIAAGPAGAAIAISAGLAAIALGAMFQGAASRGAGAMSPGYSTGAGYSPGQEQQTIKVIVEGKISGKDIVIANRRFLEDS